LFDKLDSSVGVVYCHGYRYSEKYKTKVEWKYQSVRGYVFKDYLLRGDVVIPISPLVKRYCYDIIGLENIWTGSEYDFLVMSQYVDFDYVNENLVVMRDHEKNDAKNVFSVYQRLVSYHSAVLFSDNVRSRVGTIANKRMAMDYFSFGLKFITMMEMKKGRLSLLNSIRFYPTYIFRPALLAGLFLSFLPLSFSNFLLIKSGKISL
jgi:hypothetical protein